MDVSSQKKFVQDRKNLATGQVVFESNQEVNAECACDEKALKNHEIMGNHKRIEVFNGSPNHEPVDLTGMISSPRKTTSEHEHGMEEIQPPKLGHPPEDGSKYSSLEQIEANQENETKKLSQSGNQKRGRPKKRERMVTGSPRVLRSRSQEKPKVPESVDAPAQDAESDGKKRRKTKKIKKDQNNEFSKIKTHLRYLLSRMSYEQNYIEAYAGEGWKGQSAEKIKPEKELERARSDINRYKLKIRDLFQRIDSSLEEGKIPESLYDSEGLIDSEDIFCAKCGQTEVQLDNDIILCDGECERGFHQFCLDPPLLKEQVPPGDEGWLCPACDCKVDCIDLLNDSQGADLSIGDSWEKVFPETAASGNKLDDTLGLPSDDSEDDDYNPDGPEVEKVEEEADGEESSSDESDFSSASEDLGAVANNEQSLGLPSDDSEDDDDFNPDRVDSDEQAKTKSSSSDFTSDSEDLGDINKNEGTSPEVQGSLMPEDDEEITKASMEDDDSGPITAKRKVARLDYKKLHDETYGNASSDSSDEEFLDTEAPRKQKNTKGAKDVDFNQQQKISVFTPVRRTNKKLDVEGISSSPAHVGSSAPGSSDRSGTKSSYRRLGEAATESLYQSFKENQYPDRDARENLAKELNLTHTQVSKWFENARWSFNHPGKRSKIVKSQHESSTSLATENAAGHKTVEKKQSDKASAEKLVTKQMNETSSTPPKSRKRKGKTDDEDSVMSPSLKDGSSNRRSGRVQAKRS
ncbi:pathogenesis-related homeodomain protein isoform X2 [Cynara cardunculus var. scolymus]|uniref:Homeodomain-containing protein n=1 Tax=Cynara cardunculus var. scolymus TaxID=59895 RepID=A0A103Y3K8_CYNCS|nr:pathogenesis-related homeodomain protein isoform X2 [Cynara cardunculus var. scolymus]KVI01894.1 Homeodomain-containing protein [Cynara cardunculus var. scolymus]